MSYKWIWIFSCCITVFCLYGCNKNVRNETLALVKEWQGREILFSKELSFATLDKGNIKIGLDDSKFKILVYVDSLDCISCRLKLPEWETYINELKGTSTGVLFIFSPLQKEDVYHTIDFTKFSHPICIDEEGIMNRLNHFPNSMKFQTFLLDQNNKVLAIGNPILNPKIKTLFSSIIRGETTITPDRETQVTVEHTSIDLKSFDRHQPQVVFFTLKNTGKHPLLIEGVTTSCDCTTASYTKEPVAPGDETAIKVTYTAEKPEPFYRTITVYGNTPAPIELEISGEAK